MTISDALQRIETVLIAADAAPVYCTAADLLASAAGAAVETLPGSRSAEFPGPVPGRFLLTAVPSVPSGVPGSAGGKAGVKSVSGKGAAGESAAGKGAAGESAAGEGAAGTGTGERARLTGDGPGVFLQLGADGAGRLVPTRDRYLIGFLRYLLRCLAGRSLDEVAIGVFYPVTFAWQRSVYDFFLAQEGRVQAGFDRAAYLRRLAEVGVTQVEVNSLAFPQGLETGPPGEIYPMFYTYCPALDQFVSSSLNEGLYPRDWLEANLARLKENARLAVEQGLEPGLLCFEPRSVPEEIFTRYPMLRGARVDHPFRSFKPRYNLTVTHPLVREHYAEMIRRLLQEVPELAYLSVWSNDSGAGFEYTSSLYVGRNGGAYLIREWKDDSEIARAAGENVVRFLRTLRDAGRELNPDFRVLTRLESFYAEHDTVWAGLEEGLGVETASLATRGWAMPYAHPRYPDVREINGGSVHQLDFAPEEGERLAELADRGSQAHYYFAAGPNTVFAPLIGVPYPRLTHRRLTLLHGGGVRHLAHIGGVSPPGLVPFNPNHEIVLAYQFDPGLDIETEVHRLAAEWAGEELAGTLCEAWAGAEEAILAFPNVTSLYTTFGFAWYRLWARPLVPDIEAIPETERAFYENHMCTTPHNPNNVDLSRDVLFVLARPDHCRRCVERIDANVFEPLDRAIGLLTGARERASGLPGSRNLPGDQNVIADQFVRLSALRCWFETQRNVAAWIAGVYGCTDSAGSENSSNEEAHGDDREVVHQVLHHAAGRQAGREQSRALLREMIDREIENSRRLQALCVSGVEFMATTGGEESPLMYGRNLPELLERRIALMQAHADDEPRLDHGYMMRRAAGRFAAPGSSP